MANGSLQAELLQYGVSYLAFCHDVAHISKLPNLQGAWQRFCPDAPLSDRMWRTVHDLFPDWNFDRVGSNRCYACNGAHGLQGVWDISPKNALCAKVTGMRKA